MSFHGRLLAPPKSRRTAGYAVAAAVVLGVGAAFLPRLFEGVRVVTPRAKAPVLVTPPSARDLPRDSGHLVASASAGEVKKKSAPSETTSVSVPQNRTVIDRSVIGMRFAISDSVNATCKHDPIVCPRIFRALEALAQEPRDTAWATQTEANLQHQIEALGPDKYVIRNLECRTSICAAEVSSVFGQYFGLGYYYDVKYSLLDGLATWGLETDASGAQVTVTLVTFTQYQHRCPIELCDISTMTPP